MQSSSQSSDPIQSVDIQALSKIRNDRGPIFSLYFNLHPGRNGNDLLTRFDALLSQAAQQKKLAHEPGAYQLQWADEADRVRDWLKTAQPMDARGLVLFSSLAVDLWKTFFLPVPVVDRLVASDRTYTRPLEILLRESKCTLVVFFNEEAARLVNVFLGSAEEIEDIQVVPVTGDSFTQGLQQDAGIIANKIQAAWQNRPCDHLVIGGSSIYLNSVREALSNSLGAHFIGELHGSPQVGLDELSAQVQNIEAEQERRAEAQRVEQLITSAGKSRGETAILGQEQTLLAVRAKKARLIVVEEGLHQEGGVCPNCGYLGEWAQGTCPFCEMGLRPEVDIIEAALKQVLDQGGEIDILRSPEARHALEPYGKIGAILHASAEKPVERNPATQSVITGLGKINLDALHDERVDESFPASDPPADW